MQELLGRPEPESGHEARLIAAAQAGDARARELLVEDLMPRVVALAGRFRRSGVEVGDLLQEGYLAIFDALRRFDPARGTPFWAYAAPWVRGAMFRLAHDHSRPFRLPPQALTDLGRLKRAAAQFMDEGKVDVTMMQIARRCGLDLGRAEALAAAGAPPRSLDDPVGSDGEGSALVDVLPDRRAEEAYDAVVENASRPELRALLGALSARERDVLSRRNGIGRERQTLDAVARDLGVTKERVRQIESRAVAKLRAAAMPEGD